GLALTVADREPDGPAHRRRVTHWRVHNVQADGHEVDARDGHAVAGAAARSGAGTATKRLTGWFPTCGASRSVVTWISALRTLVARHALAPDRRAFLRVNTAPPARQVSRRNQEIAARLGFQRLS